MAAASPNTCGRSIACWRSIRARAAGTWTGDRGSAALIRHYIEHRAERESQVLAALQPARRPSTICWRAFIQVCSRRSRPMARESLLAHLVKLESDGRARARAAASAFATATADAAYTERLDGPQRQSGRGGVPVPLRASVSRDGPTADRARRFRAADPAAGLRRLHDVAGAPKPRPGAHVLEPQRRPRRDLGDRPGACGPTTICSAAACRDLADRSAVLRIEHSTRGRALRPARARSPALAVRHRPARSGV